MSDKLNKRMVLVLNRNWQAIHITTPAMAFCQMATDVATALDILGEDTMVATPWEQWLNLPVRASDESVRTVRGSIRVPTVIVAVNFSRVPLKRPTFSMRAIRERDKSRCQYTGRTLDLEEGNIDHVVPKSRGGKTSWTNCVLACRKVNNRKGNRTPEEAGLRLMRKPQSPRAVPSTLLLANVHGIKDWEPFLVN